ncbi:MAG: adenylate kinase [Chloroflexi bacterium]|nr:adenylate kinase [Chloroflexota bacterium]
MSGSLRLALFGPPGAGKGTQAQLLKDKLNLAHISSGDLFRHHLGEGTELGTRASEFMNKGLLVPDGLVIGMVLGEVAGLGQDSGFILDGFPRTREQAEALDTALKVRSQPLDLALLVSVPEAELVRRLGGRFICRECQAPHNLEESQFTSPPRCERCSGELYQRDDDRPDAIQVRIGVYQKQTAPVLDFYRERGLLKEISGVGAVEEINARAITVLGLDSPGQVG